MNNSEFHSRMAMRARQTTEFLDAMLSETVADGELDRPARLLEAMRYAVLNGGKRLRPFLLLETAEMFGETGESAPAGSFSTGMHPLLFVGS